MSGCMYYGWMYNVCTRISGPYGPQILALAEGWLATLTRGLATLNLVWGLRPSTSSSIFWSRLNIFLVSVKQKLGFGQAKIWSWSKNCFVSVDIFFCLGRNSFWSQSKFCFGLWPNFVWSQSKFCFGLGPKKIWSRTKFVLVSVKFLLVLVQILFGLG